MYTISELIGMMEGAGGFPDLVALLRNGPPGFAEQFLAEVNSIMAEDEAPSVPPAPVSLTPDQLARVHNLMREEQNKLIARIKASRRHEVVGAFA